MVPGQASVPVVPIGRQSGTSGAAQTQDKAQARGGRRVPSSARRQIRRDDNLDLEIMMTPLALSPQKERGAIYLDHGRVQ